MLLLFRDGGVLGAEVGPTPSPCQAFVPGLSVELFGGCRGPPELPSLGAPAVDVGGLSGWLFLWLQRKFPASSGSGRCPRILPPGPKLCVWQSLAYFLPMNPRVGWAVERSLSCRCCSIPGWEFLTDLPMDQPSPGHRV